MQQYLERLFSKIESTPINLQSWLMALLAIIGIRFAIEFFLENMNFAFADEYFYQVSHFFLAIIFNYLAALFCIIYFARVNITRVAIISLFGCLVIWTPPIIDEIISNGNGFWSFYAFDSPSGLVERYFTFFGDRPDVGITYGIRIEIAIILLFTAVYIWVKTKNFLRTFLATLVLYTCVFFLGAFPSIVTFVLLGPEKGLSQVTELDVARLMLSPEPLFVLNPPDVERVLSIKMGLIYTALLPILITGLMFCFFRPILSAFWHNIRIPQILYHLGLFAFGASLAFLYEGKSAFELNWLHLTSLPLLAYAVILAWITSVIVNDLYDTRIDVITNPNRPLIKHTIDPDLYKTIGIMTFGGSIFCAAFISTQLSLLLVLYQSLAWIYSAPPLRLKRFPLLATILASAASLLVFFGGYIVFSVEKNIAALPWSVPTLLFIAYTFLLPIKDFKDIPGDRADDVFTLPVILGEKKAKQLIGAVLLLIFMVSVFVFDVPHFFLLAFFFGSLAYWLLQISSKDHKYFNYHHLAHWYVALISAYVFFLALHFISR